MVIAIVAIVFVIFYQEYMGEDAATATDVTTNSLINKRLNAVVTDTSVNKANAANYLLKIGYTDIDTKAAASFFMDYRDRASIAIGDTVTKEKGEKLILIYRQQGAVISVPID
ncbi:hypothetical protein [Spirosoma pollinicola]|nr:hypothetical protein [Spirosoma pollinicola]